MSFSTTALRIPHICSVTFKLTFSHNHQSTRMLSVLEKQAALTGLVSILVLIAPFSPRQGERNGCVNTKFTRPVNKIWKSSLYILKTSKEVPLHLHLHILAH